MKATPVFLKEENPREGGGRGGAQDKSHREEGEGVGTGLGSQRGGGLLISSYNAMIRRIIAPYCSVTDVLLVVMNWGKRRWGRTKIEHEGE